MATFKNKGFTLIELLVVISIIGILASTVLVSFPGATKKAKDSRVISAVAQARTVMVYTYANNQSYEDFDCTHNEMTTLCEEVFNNSYENTALTIRNSEEAACMYVPLNSKDGASWYCADSRGRAGTTEVNPGGTGYCDGIDFICPPVSG